MKPKHVITAIAIIIGVIAASAPPVRALIVRAWSESKRWEAEQIQKRGVEQVRGALDA